MITFGEILDHNCVEALGFKNIGNNGNDVFIRGKIKVTFAGDKPVISVDDRIVEVSNVKELKAIIGQGIMFSNFLN